MVAYKPSQLHNYIRALQYLACEPPQILFLQLLSTATCNVAHEYSSLWAADYVAFYEPPGHPESAVRFNALFKCFDIVTWLHFLSHEPPEIQIMRARFNPLFNLAHVLAQHNQEARVVFMYKPPEVRIMRACFDVMFNLVHV